MKTKLRKNILFIMDDKVRPESPPVGADKSRSIINDYFTILDSKDKYFGRLEKELLTK